MKIEFAKQVRAQLKCLRISTKRKKGGFINAIERAIRYKFIRENLLHWEISKLPSIQFVSTEFFSLY